MIYVVSYKNIKNELKGGWKKKIPCRDRNPCQPPLVSAPGFITEFE
jgi:hypothetical protein